MKQSDLAKILGASPPYISSVMSGNENLTAEQMSRLAEAVGGLSAYHHSEEGRPYSVGGRRFGGCDTNHERIGSIHEA